MAVVDRLQLLELEDQSWLPRVVRDGATDLLDTAFERLRFYDGVAPHLGTLLDATGATCIVDLCSGGGGGTLALARRLRGEGRRVDVILTDLYPNQAGQQRVAALGDPAIRYHVEPVDALKQDSLPAGVRTMASALHHFPPDAVAALLRAIVSAGQPLAFFDVAASPVLRRLPLTVALPMLLINGLMLLIASLLLVPFVRPFRWSRIVFTYLVPAIPLVVAWDGTVSALRAYAPEELLALVGTVEGSSRYAWRAGRAGQALYMTGTPLPPRALSPHAPPG